MSVHDLLSKIDSIKQDKIETIVLSTGKKITLDPLNLKQQKSIMSTSINGVKGLISYPRIINEVILEASKTEDLLIIDKPLLVLALRHNSIGDLYNNVSISALIEKIQSTKIDFLLKDTISYKNLIIDIALPTLSEENKVIKRLESLVVEDADAYNLELAYSYEIIKYIKRVSIDDIEINFTELNISDRALVLDKIPLPATKQIIAFIEKYRDIEKEWLTDGDTTIEINSELFDIE